MNIEFTPTPFGTIHATAHAPADKESQLKAQVTRRAKPLGLTQLSRRSHVIGDTVTVFTIYRRRSA